MFPDSQPAVNFGQGDGTVNAVSLLGCDLWNSTKYAFDHHYVQEGGEHLGILAAKEFADYIIKHLNIK